MEERRKNHVSYSKFYRHINAPIERSPNHTSCRADPPSVPLDSLPDIHELIKIEYEKQNSSKLKQSKLQSLQKQYKDHIASLELKIEGLKQQLKNNEHLKELQSSKPSNKQLAQLLLLSAEIDRLRRCLAMNEANILEKEEHIGEINQKHSQQLQIVSLTLSKKYSKELGRIKDELWKTMNEIKDQYALQILEVRKSQSGLKITVEYLIEEMERMKKENGEVREQNLDLKAKMREALEREKERQSEKRRQDAKNQTRRMVDRSDGRQYQSPHKDDPEERHTARLSQLEKINAEKDLTILKLQKRTQLLQDELKIQKELVKLQPRSDKKEEFRRGDQSLEISLENSNLNQKERIKIEDLIRECKSEIRTKDDQIESLSQQLKDKIGDLIKAEQLIAFKDEKISQLMQDPEEDGEMVTQVQELKDQIREKENKVELLESELARRKEALVQKDGEIGELKRREKEKQEECKRLMSDLEVMREMFEDKVKRNGERNS